MPRIPIGDAGDPSKSGDVDDPSSSNSDDPRIADPDDSDDDDEQAGVIGSHGGGSRVGSIIDAQPPAKESKKADTSNSLTLPFFRVPSASEVPAGTWPSMSSFYTTVEIPLPTLGEFLAALRVVPQPPPPGPSIRTQQEAPVLDAGSGTSGGAVGGSGSASSSQPPVFQAPLVVSVPRAMTVAGAGPRVTRPGQAGEPAATAPGAAGVPTPRIRGSVAPTPGTSVAPAPLSATGQMAGPAGYPRVLTGPTLAEIAAVALPGLGGLMLVTFGGGVLGYRQANSLRFVRTAGAERFLA